MVVITEYLVCLSLNLKNWYLLFMKISPFLIFIIQILLVNVALSQDDMTSKIDSLEKYRFVRSDSVLHELELIRNTELSKSNSERIVVITASIFASQRKTDTAYTILNEYVHRSEIANKLSLADAYSEIGQIWRSRGKLDSLILFSKMALQIGEEIENYGVINVAANDIGYGFVLSDLYDSATIYYQKSYEANQILGDSLRMASCKNNMFVMYYRLGNFEKAIEALIESIRIKEKASDARSYISGMLNLSAIYIKLEQYKEAKVLINNAVERCEFEGILDLEIKLLSNYGSILTKEDKPDSSLIFHLKALHLADSLDLEGEKGKAYRNLGVVYEKLNKDNLAVEYGLKALEIQKKRQSNRTIALTENNLAVSYLKLKQTTKARKYLFDAYQISKEIDELELQVKVNETMALYYKELGNFKNALKYHQLYKSYDDSLNSMETEKVIRELEAKYENEKKENEIFQLTSENQLNQFEIVKKEQQLRQNRIIITSIIIVVFLILLAAYLLFARYRLRQRNTQMNLERQKLEIEHRMLRSQMNPHFIFNSLNSINSLILTKDVEKANQYLLNFSELLRSILENSRHEFIALNDEIEMMRSYADVEKFRFNNTFDIEVIDETDESEFIAIPPMLMQPFFENSIKHAFNNITYRGKITIRYTIDGDFLLCQIEDNGVGIKATLEKKNLKSNHQSLALNLIHKRIEILQKEWNSSIDLIITDWSETSDEQMGTKVLLKLPIKDL